MWLWMFVASHNDVFVLFCFCACTTHTHLDRVLSDSIFVCIFAKSNRLSRLHKMNPRNRMINTHTHTPIPNQSIQKNRESTKLWDWVCLWKKSTEIWFNSFTELLWHILCVCECLYTTQRHEFIKNVIVFVSLLLSSKHSRTTNREEKNKLEWYHEECGGDGDKHTHSFIRHQFLMATFRIFTFLSLLFVHIFHVGFVFLSVLGWMLVYLSRHIHNTTVWFIFGPREWPNKKQIIDRL